MSIELGKVNEVTEKVVVDRITEELQAQFITVRQIGDAISANHKKMQHAALDEEPKTIDEFRTNHEDFFRDHDRLEASHKVANANFWLCASAMPTNAKKTMTAATTAGTIVRRPRALNSLIISVTSFDLDSPEA